MSILSPLSVRRLRAAIVPVGVWLVSSLSSAEVKPTLGPGATKDQVIDTYGWPNGQSHAGGREILSYQQGRVVLKDGVVERMDFSPDVAWPVPKPRPKPATAIQARPAATPKPVLIDPWLTSYNDALAEAKKRDTRILALFTGMDWSPAGKKFQEEVALDPSFTSTVGAEYVLLRLDYPRTNTQAPALREQNAELRERFEITTYPSAMLLTSDGREYARIDLAKGRAQATFREQVIAAIQEANPTPGSAAWLAQKPIEASTAGNAAAVASIPKRDPWILAAVTTLLLIVAWVFWSRRPRKVVAVAPPKTLPTTAEIGTWSHTVLRDVCAILFEAESKKVQPRESESGADLAIFRADGETKPDTLVRCLPGAEGAASISSARDLLGTMIAEGVRAGWYVAPAGFAEECAGFAAAQSITLVNAEDLRRRVEALAPVNLERVLVATG